jgi:hypothetical protein
MQIIQELKRVLPELDIRSLNESTDSNKVTILLSDKKECLIVCIQDDTKDNVYEAAGLSIYSNTKSIILSYLAIFETLWKQSQLLATWEFRQHLILSNLKGLDEETLKNTACAQR